MTVIDIGVVRNGKEIEIGQDQPAYVRVFKKVILDYVMLSSSHYLFDS